MKNDLNATLRKSVSLNIVGRYSNLLIQVGLTALLAHMLTPAQFGLVAVLTVVVSLFTSLSEMGLGAAITHFHDLPDSKIAVILWLTIALGMISASLLYASANAIAALYHEPSYRQITHTLGLAVLFACWNIVPLNLLRKRQRFGSLAAAEVFSAVVSGALALTLAFLGHGVAALVWKGVAYLSIMFVTCVALSRPPAFARPRPGGLKPVYAYAGYQFGSNAVGYLAQNIDKLIIGKILGAGSLGLYDMAYRLMLLPVNNLTHVITPAMQPAYSVHRKTPDVIFESYQTVVRILIVVGCPLSATCFFGSSEIIHIFYGPQWTPAVPVFAIMSVAILPLIVTSSAESIFQALGRTDLLFISGLWSIAGNLLAAGLALWKRDLIDISMFFAASFIMHAVASFWLLCRHGFRCGLGALFGPARPSIVACAMLMAACAALFASVDLAASPLLRLIEKGTLIGACYVVILALTGNLHFLKGVFAHGG